MREIIHKLARLFALLSALFVLVMMFVTTADVVVRWYSGRSIAGAQEFSESFMVAIVYFGLAYALFSKEHVAVTVLTSRIPIRPAAVLRLTGQSIMIALVAWMIWVTGEEALRSFTSGEIRFGLLQVKLWPARTIIPLGLLAFLLQAILDYYDQIHALRTGHVPSVNSTTPEGF
jgi:TRAP-type C4-dicarboxylate transport system permease small subunit